MRFQWVNLKHYYNPQEVRELLGQCMWPDEERIANEYELYRATDSLQLMGVVRSRALIGFVGLDEQQEHTLIKHIAIKSEYRGLGYGRQLMVECALRYRMPLIAETDQEAVDFYRRVGFQIESLGEKYPGVERYQCILDDGD